MRHIPLSMTAAADREPPKGRRWANLPPELRAIKERWLGSSGEEISCSLPENGVMWSFPGSEGEEVGSRCGKKDAHGQWGAEQKGAQLRGIREGTYGYPEFHERQQHVPSVRNDGVPVWDERSCIRSRGYSRGFLEPRHLKGKRPLGSLAAPHIAGPGHQDRLTTTLPPSSDPSARQTSAITTEERRLEHSAGEASKTDPRHNANERPAVPQSGTFAINGLKEDEGLCVEAAHAFGDSSQASGWSSRNEAARLEGNVERAVREEDFSCRRSACGAGIDGPASSELFDSLDIAASTSQRSRLSKWAPQQELSGRGLETVRHLQGSRQLPSNIEAKDAALLPVVLGGGTSTDEDTRHPSRQHRQPSRDGRHYKDKRESPAPSATPEICTDSRAESGPKVCRASEGPVNGILDLEHARESPFMNPRKFQKDEPAGWVKTKRGRNPGVSGLRAPGWGLAAVITAIPPAPLVMGASKVDGPSSADTPNITPAAMTACLPDNLLTPVTEAATLEEQSVISCNSNRTTAKTTPVSSVGSRPACEDSRPCRARRWQRPRPSPHDTLLDYHHGTVRRRVESTTDGACVTESVPCRQNERASWVLCGANHSASTGCHSAPSGASARPTNRNGVSDGQQMSLAYRARLPCAGDRMSTKGSTFSSVSDEIRTERASGYAAAMGRRARSVARCRAARKLVTMTKATRRMRPSTPIAERARWGEGRKTTEEVERRQLLQRQAEYAEKLKRKAKIDAAAVAARNRTAPAHLSEGQCRGGTTSGPACEVGHKADPCKCSVERRSGRVPHALSANDDAHHLPVGDHIPIPYCHGERSGAAQESMRRAEFSTRVVDVDSSSCAGREDARGQHVLERRPHHAEVATDGDEKGLLASIARLDALLHVERGDFEPVSTSPGDEKSKEAGPFKDVHEKERKQSQSWTIAKPRVRKGTTKAAQTSSASTTVPVTACVMTKVPAAGTVGRFQPGGYPVASSCRTTIVDPASLPPLVPRRLSPDYKMVSLDCPPNGGDGGGVCPDSRTTGSGVKEEFQVGWYETGPLCHVGRGHAAPVPCIDPGGAPPTTRHTHDGGMRTRARTGPVERDPLGACHPAFEGAQVTIENERYASDAQAHVPRYTVVTREEHASKVSPRMPTLHLEKYGHDRGSIRTHVEIDDFIDRDHRSNRYRRQCAAANPSHRRLRQAGGGRFVNEP